MNAVSARKAVEAIPDGARVVLPHGAVEPTTLYDALCADGERLRGVRLYSGLQFGGYSFLHGEPPGFRYTTWQASPKLRDLFRRRRIDFLPLRFRDVVRVIARDGLLPPDVVLVQVTPPRGGAVSLGISVSLYRDLIASARLVIGEVNESMPWTGGASVMPVASFDLLVRSDLPLGTYRPTRRTERDDRIADHVLGLLPAGAWVQLGVGAVPDTILSRLHEVREINLHSGMLTDGLIEFVSRSRHRARVVTGEVCGGDELYRFVAEHPQVELHPCTVTHDLLTLARLPGFVSINSAVEVDLGGQVNGETVDGVQISGVGGSLDFVEGAAYSPGGLSIVALPSTTEDGRRAKIVVRLGEAAPATIPRFCADYVVTEFGSARLRGKTLRERAAALIAIAHPEHRAELERGADL